jgi:PPP family 3-phenylpropionic acid transporter
LLASPTLIRTIVIPAAAHLADHHDAVRATLIGLAVGYAACSAVLGLSEGAWQILIAYTLASAAFAPVMPLSDAYALRGLALRKRSYGPVRLWGSAAFIVGSFAAGLLLDVIPARHLIWLIVAAAVLAAAAALALAPLRTAPADVAAAGTEPSAIWRNPALLAVAAAAGLIQASHAVYYGFSALDWRIEGFDTTTIGVLWALGVVAEIALFAVSARLPLQGTALLLLGGAGAVLRWVAMALDPPALALPLLQCLHALSFGATHLGAIAVLAQVAPASRSAAAQSSLSIMVGLAMAGALALAGALYAAYGGAAYLAMAGLALAGSGLALASRRLMR